MFIPIRIGTKTILPVIYSFFAVNWREEVLCSGALPLMEWQVGLSEIFPQTKELPAVHSYDEIKEMTRYYLRHDCYALEVLEIFRFLISAFVLYLAALPKFRRVVVI